MRVRRAGRRTAGSAGTGMGRAVFCVGGVSTVLGGALGSGRKTHEEASEWRRAHCGSSAGYAPSSSMRRRRSTAAASRAPHAPRGGPPASVEIGGRAYGDALPASRIGARRMSLPAGLCARGGGGGGRTPSARVSSERPGRGLRNAVGGAPGEPARPFALALAKLGAGEAKRRRSRSASSALEAADGYGERRAKSCVCVGWWWWYCGGALCGGGAMAVPAARGCGVTTVQPAGPGARGICMTAAGCVARRARRRPEPEGTTWP